MVFGEGLWGKGWERVRWEGKKGWVKKEGKQIPLARAHPYPELVAGVSSGLWVSSPVLLGEDICPKTSMDSMGMEGQ